MTWALILHFAFTPPGASTAQRSDLTAGLMANRQVCVIAGAGMVAILEAANPGLTVRFTCEDRGQAA
jgi:hypothetical protein